MFVFILYKKRKKEKISEAMIIPKEKRERKRIK